MTIKQIAELAGVSISTVSKVVNNKASNIPQETIDRVLKVVKEYNYAPYRSLQRQDGAKTFTIGVLCRDLSKRSTLVTHITKQANTKGYGVLLFDSDNDQRQELKHLTAIRAKQVDGIIWEPVHTRSLQHRPHLQEQAVILVGEYAKGEQENLSLDISRLSYGATEKLISLGHRDITYIGDSPSMIGGFKNALLSHQIPFKERMIVPFSDIKLDKLYHRSPTACIIETHENAQELRKQLGVLHIAIPYDLSIIALIEDSCNSEISAYMMPNEAYGTYLAEEIIQRCENYKKESALFSMEPKISGTATIDIPVTSRKKATIVVGSLNVDINLNVSDLPTPGKTLMAEQVQTMAGGKGVNQAVGLARLGKPVHLIGKVGTDYESSIILKTLESYDIDTTTIMHDSFAQTGAAYIHLQPDGESTITVAQGANGTLSSTDIEAQAHLFEHADYCLLQTEVPLPPLVTAAKIAKKQGITTILKPAGLKQISKDLFALIDILIPNEKEAAILSGKTTLQEQGAFFIQHGIDVVIITRSNKGAYLRTRTEEQHIPASSAATPIDTTGGADAFIAAFTVYLSFGYTIAESIHIANVAAGYSVSRFGTHSSMVDQVTLDHYVSRLGAE